MNGQLQKTIIVLFVLVLATSSSLHKTLARFQSSDAMQSTARVASFDVEVQYPEEFLLDQGLSFYSPSVSKKYHFYVENNSEVTVKSQITAKSSGFVLDFSETEFVLERGENKCIEVTIRPGNSRKNSEQVKIAVKSEQVD